MINLQGMFITILNMSITASYVAICLILVRIILRKAPKIFSYALWSVVLFRLICPLTFFTDFSFFGLLNMNSLNNGGLLEYVPNDIGFIQTPTVQSGIDNLDSAVNTYLPQATPIASANPMQIWLDLLSFIWIAGIVILLFYSILSYIKIKRKLLTATLVNDNVYESDRIGTAFVCGFIHPKIYLPVGVREANLSYILEHERTHIRRKDYLIKPVAFFALILHWFNPLMWLSFALMSRDMEMSCDESVLQKMSYDAKCGYSNSLLTLSVKSNGLFASNPLAFGESHVKARIKNVLNYKKPVFWVVIASVIIVISVGIGLLSNPTSSEPDLSFLNPNSMLSTIGEQEKIKIESTDYGNAFVSGIELAKWLDVAENDWKRKIVSSPYELSPSMTIHVDDKTGNEIRFFKSKPTIAMTLYQNQYRYYKIPEEDYSALSAMAEMGYPLVQSITFTEHENGSDDTSVTISDHKTIMRMAVLMQNGEKYRSSLFLDSTQNDIPPVSDYIRIEMSGDETYNSYFLYSGNENYYIDKPYDHINKISFNTMKEIITIFTDVGNKQMKEEIGFIVESKLDIIMSSPKTSSNPQDYINAHEKEYHYFFKYGGEEALQYMLTQFEVGNAEGLRGQIMMSLCKELLGNRNNVTDQSLSPQEWYDALSIRQEIRLPHFEYDGQDSIEKLVYDTEIEMDSASNNRGGFIIVAPKVFGYYEEEDMLKVFVTTYSARYKLYENTLSQEGGSIIPAAITYRKDDNGRYKLEKYEQARDGSEFGPSIRGYCTFPVSGKQIKGLADEIFNHYSDYDDIRVLLHDNLYNHLKKNGITDAILTNFKGEIEFSMSDPKYKP